MMLNLKTCTEDELGAAHSLDEADAEGVHSVRGAVLQQLVVQVRLAQRQCVLRQATRARARLQDLEACTVLKLQEQLVQALVLHQDTRDFCLQQDGAVKVSLQAAAREAHLVGFRDCTERRAYRQACSPGRCQS